MKEKKKQYIKLRKFDWSSLYSIPIVLIILMIPILNIYFVWYSINNTPKTIAKGKECLELGFLTWLLTKEIKIEVMNN